MSRFWQQPDLSLVLLGQQIPLWEVSESPGLVLQEGKRFSSVANQSLPADATNQSPVTNTAASPTNSDLFALVDSSSR